MKCAAIVPTRTIANPMYRAFAVLVMTNTRARQSAANTDSAFHGMSVSDWSHAGR